MINVAIPNKPVTRKQEFYDAILKGGKLPTPITNDEEYLRAIAENMSSGGDIDLSAYIKTVNNQKPKASGNVELLPNHITCTDTSGFNKTNLKGYIDFLCSEVKAIRAILETLTPPPTEG